MPPVLESRFTQTGTYIVDPERSRISFAARENGVAVLQGAFAAFEGGGYFDIERPESSLFDVTVDARSITTGHSERDLELKGADVLDVLVHPTITFTSMSVDQTGTRTYRVEGDLAIKGVGRPVVLTVERTGWVTERAGSQRIGFEGKAVLHPQHWGLASTEPRDPSDHVAIEFEISALKTPYPES